MTRLALIAGLAGTIALSLGSMSANAAVVHVGKPGIHKPSMTEKVHYRWYRFHRHHHHYRYWR